MIELNRGDRLIILQTYNRCVVSVQVSQGGGSDKLIIWWLHLQGEIIASNNASKIHTGF